jgi:cyclophilin family peptidyl-prolyl cis-trans isomerase
MSQRSRDRAGSGRRPKDVRRSSTGRGPAAGRVQRAAVRGGSAVRSGPPVDPRLIAAGVVGAVLLVTAIAFGSGLFGRAAATQAPCGSAVANGCPTSQPAALPAGQTRTVTIATSKGDIVIKVDGSLSPIAAGNFVALATCGYYDGVVFHRTASLPDGTPFVIQGGDGQFGRFGSPNSYDPGKVGQGGPGYTIQDEPVTTTYRRGTVAMARSSAPNSEGSQFFIVLDDKDAATLAQANNYAIFGNVTSGMAVADAIFAASAGNENPPNPIPMTKVTVSNP